MNRPDFRKLASRFAFFSLLVILPLVNGRSDKRLSAKSFYTLLCLAIVFATAFNYLEFYLSTPSEIAINTTASAFQREVIARKTSFPLTQNIAISSPSFSYTTVFSMVSGIFWLFIQAVSENLFVLLIPLIPFSIIERFFRVNMIFPAMLFVCPYFAFSHSGWGFSLLGLLSFIPAAVIFVYVLYKYGFLKSVEIHFSYNLLVFIISMVTVLNIG